MRWAIFQMLISHFFKNMVTSFFDVFFGKFEVFGTILDIFDYARSKELVVGILEDDADARAEFLEIL